MNKLTKVFVCSALAMSFAACSNSSQPAADDKPASSEAKEVLIGISPDYPPYESVDTDGNIEGFDVDMTKWLFDYLNENGHDYKYDFVELSFDTIISSLQAGQIDLGISGFTVDEERQGIFSDAYYKSGQVIVVNSASDIKSAADLNGKTVGAQQGATGAKAAASIEGAKVNEVSDVKLLMETLKSDGIDAVVLDTAVAQNYAKSGDYKILDEVLMEEENVIYTTDEHKELMDEINEAIKAFVASDDYETLTAKWFSENE